MQPPGTASPFGPAEGGRLSSAERSMPRPLVGARCCPGSESERLTPHLPLSNGEETSVPAWAGAGSTLRTFPSGCSSRNRRPHGGRHFSSRRATPLIAMGDTSHLDGRHLSSRWAFFLLILQCNFQKQRSQFPSAKKAPSKTQKALPPLVSDLLSQEA